MIDYYLLDNEEYLNRVETHTKGASIIDYIADRDKLDEIDFFLDAKKEDWEFDYD